MTSWASATWLAGFITRAVSVVNPSNMALFNAQYVLVFVGPPLFAASEYFILRRLLAYLPYHASLHPGRVMSTFLLLSATVESLAASGAADIASASAEPGVRSAAIARIKASLILQEVLEACFFVVVALIEYRSRRAGHFPRNVCTVCRILYITSLMMTLRCVVRTIDATDCDPATPDFKGYCGPVQRYEWFLWLFEVAHITVFIALLAIFHPGRYLPSTTTQYLDPADGADGGTERIGDSMSLDQG